MQLKLEGMQGKGRGHETKVNAMQDVCNGTGDAN